MLRRQQQHHKQHQHQHCQPSLSLEVSSRSQPLRWPQWTPNLLCTWGTASDPWIVTASLASGPGTLANNVTCAFEQGLCVFGDLAIDTEGGDYSLSFELTYPTDLDTPIPPVVRYPFDVETRILSSMFTHLKILVPVNQVKSHEMLKLNMRKNLFPNFICWIWNMYNNNNNNNNKDVSSLAGCDPATTSKSRKIVSFKKLW